MARIPITLALSTLVAGAAFSLFVPQGFAQRDVVDIDPDQAQSELERATRESQRAQARSERLFREAQEAGDEADRAAREAAAVAAQIQATEADIVSARARYSLAQSDREELAERLARRQEPLVQLTGALQTSSRRPLALSALQPGSLKDLVYVRAVLASAVPEIQSRTSSLRGELEEGRRLEAAAADALSELATSEQDLQARRDELAQLEARQRFVSREARRNASREGERALALAEEARDLDGLIDRIDQAASLRRELGALPGPLLRPGTDSNLGIDPGAGQSQAIVASETSATPPAGFQLPVQGRTVTGFGELRESGLRSTGLALGPSPGAIIVAPSDGRTAFAGPYRGFGRIVIIEHEGGWTSLITGLAQVNVSVGERLIGGAPLGTAAREDPVVTIELRQSGEPVNPLNYLN